MVKRPRIGSGGDAASGLEALERGQCIELRRILAPELGRLSHLDPSIREPVEAARRRLQRLQYEFSRLDTFGVPGGRRGADIAADIRIARRDLAQAFREAGIAEEAEASFSLSDIAGLAPEGGAILAPLATSIGGGAYVIPSGAAAVTQAHVLDLPNLTLAAVNQLVDRWQEAYRSITAATNRNEAQPRKAFEDVLQATLHSLWRLLVGPALNFLRNSGLQHGAEIVILPTGGLSLFPLHAVSDPATERCLLDDYAVSYVPSLLSLNSVVSGHPVLLPTNLDCSGSSIRKPTIRGLRSRSVSDLSGRR